MARERIAFDNQVVIVTGGGRGLGQAYCLELARRGARVVINDLASEYADDVAAQIAELGAEVAVSYDDVGSVAGCEAIVDTALKRFGTVHSLIHSAGNTRNGLFEDLTEADFEAVVDVHLKGTFFLTQAAWKVMKKNGYGRVVLTGSASGMFGHSGNSNYAAAKAGVYGICRALAAEGRDVGILVNTLLPRAATTIASRDPTHLPGLQGFWADGPGAVLAPRRTPASVAPMAVFLASEGCEVTGEAFDATAGSFSRVVVAKPRGWIARVAETVSVEDIVAHIDEIMDVTGGELSIPSDTYDDMRSIGGSIEVVTSRS